MERYDSYKDSGVEWIGDIPNGWNLVPIKYLVSTKVTDGPHETPNFVEDGIPFLSVESVQDGKLDFNKKRGFISKDLHNEYSKKCKPQKDDIFIVKSGSTTGKSTIVETDEDFNIWSPICIVRPKKEVITSRFTFLSIQSFYFRRFVELGWSFGTQPNIGMGVIENLRLVVPPILEQQQIVSYLDTKTSLIDSLIEKTQRKIELLKENRISLINEVVTKGLNPNVEMKDSGVEWIGEIPISWITSKLGFYTTKIGSGSTPRGGSEVYVDSGIPFIRSQNVHFDGLKLEDVSFIEYEVHNSMRGSTVVKNDVLLNITGGSIGRCCVVDIEWEMNVNQHVSIIRTTYGLVNYFLNYILSCDLGQSQVRYNLTGGNREGLTIEGIRDFQITIPPLSEQQQIVSYLDEHTQLIDKTISVEERRIDTLKEYRQSLISEVVTGKRKVVD